MPYIKAMEGFTNAGGMISEQLWDSEDLPGRRTRKGQPTGAAMPLCWSHAEYISLVRSYHDGVCYDKVEPAYRRYVEEKVTAKYEIWGFRHQLKHIPEGKILRLIYSNDADLVWTDDIWIHTRRTKSERNKLLNLWYADLEVNELKSGDTIEFTFFWKVPHKWEGRNYKVIIESKI
jgi:glucoamylase